MLNQKEILSTIEMIDQQHLDIRTITMGISLLSCCDPDPKRACEKIYEKIILFEPAAVPSAFGSDVDFSGLRNGDRNGHNRTNRNSSSHRTGVHGCGPW